MLHLGSSLALVLGVDGTRDLRFEQLLTGLAVHILSYFCPLPSRLSRIWLGNVRGGLNLFEWPLPPLRWPIVILNEIWHVGYILMRRRLPVKFASQLLLWCLTTSATPSNCTAFYYFSLVVATCHCISLIYLLFGISLFRGLHPLFIGCCSICRFLDELVCLTHSK